MANQDEILGILGSIIGGVAEGTINTQNLNKKLDHELEQDSLRQDYDLMKMELAEESELERLAYKDSLDVKNQAYMDSVAQARLDDTQLHAKEMENFKSRMGLIPAQTAIATQGIADEIQSLDQQYGAIQAKMALRNQGIANAKTTPIDLEHLRGKKLREFFDESMWMGLNESDIIASYNSAKRNDVQTLDSAINTAIMLPAHNPKRKSMVKLVDDMLEKLGITYNEKGERQISNQDMYDDFTDGDWGLGGGIDPQGQSAKAIIEELEGYRHMLSGGEKSIDQLYEISPDCLFYTSPRPRDGEEYRMPSSA